MATQTSILANQLLIPFELDSPKLRFDPFTKTGEIRGEILEKLLLYDRVIIPTIDFAILPPLVHWLTPPLFKDMINSGSLSFVRFSGSIGYVGNGNGLAMFEIHPGPSKPADWWIQVTYCDPDEAAQLQLTHRLQGISAQERHTIVKLVADNTLWTKLREFDSKVKHETYMDVLNSPPLRLYFGIRNTNMNWLTGVDPNQMRVFSSIAKPAVAGDEIDVTLRLGMLNLQIYLADESNADDMVTDRSIVQLLDAKFERLTRVQRIDGAFKKLLKLEKIPDIIPPLTRGEIDASALWRLRNSRHGQSFRKWFQQHGSKEPDKLVEEYVQILHEPRLIDKWPLKIIRIAVISSTGLIPILGPLAGAALSAVDSFLLDKVAKGASPRYFIDELHHHFFNT